MGGDAIEAYGALLDGSLAQIREASRDARTFDRAAVHRAADVWDNNTHPLFRAARARTARGRERRARAGLRWMSELGPERRDWMAGLLGPEGGRLLPPAPASQGPAVDHRGRVRPEPVPLTAAACEELALDYVMSRAEVRLFRLEREGDRLTASVRLAVPRGFAVEDPYQPQTEVTFSVDDVTEARFDSSDVRGATPTAGADGVSLALGAAGVVSGGAATAWVDDAWWYLSRAGRRAAEQAVGVPGPVPRRRGRPRGALHGPALETAAVLWHAMIRMRGVRNVRRVADLRLREMCDVFDGAGAAVVAAGSRRTSRSRDAAFERLLGTWIGRTDPALHRWLGWVLRQHGMPTLPAGAADGGVPAPTSPAGPAALRLAQYTAPRERSGTRHGGEVVLHLAVPSRDDAEAPWRMHVPEPSQPARFRLRTEAFRGTGRLVGGDFENGPDAFLLSPRR